MNRLWTKNYTIITIGSVVSMLGNSMAGFAMSLFVLDYTQSPLYYAIYMFLYTLPQIAAPVLAGPLMDRFSRRRTIYMLDFASTAIYALLAGLMHLGLFSFWAFASITFIIGTIHSAYTVAFESFYPMLVSEGNYIKAYSVLSTLETLVLVMIPVSTFLYKTVGMVWLMRGGQEWAERLKVHLRRLYGGYEGGYALPLDGKGPFVYNPVFHILLYGHGRI